jgi:hypothetical protein
MEVADSGTLDSGMLADSTMTGPADTGAADSGAAADTGTPMDATLESGAADTGEPGDSMSDTGAVVEAGMESGTDASGESGSDSASPLGCGATMAILGGNASTVFASTWNGAWTPVQTLTGSVASVPALTANGASYVGAVRETSTNDIDYTVSGATWSALAGVPAAASATATTGGPPALVDVGGTVHLVYWGLDDKFYHGTFAAGAWTPADDPVGGSSTQSFGPSAPTAAALASSFTIAQAGSNADVYAQSWSSTWSPAVQVATDGYDLSSPRIVTLTGGSASQMIVYARDDNSNDEALMYSVLTGSTWSTPALVDNATVFTPNPVALAPLAGGGAVLVYQGANGEGYYATYNGSAWTAPEPLVATSNPTLASPPQVAAGVCGADAVAVFATQASGPLSITTMTGSTWSTPSTLAGTTGATYATIATQPCTSTMAIVGGSATTAFATTWTLGAWAAAQTLSGSVVSVPAVVSNGSQYVGVLREANTNDIGYTVSGTTWSALAGVPAAGSATATTGGPPALAVVDGAVHLVYWGLDDKFYHGTYATGAWTPADDPVGGASTQSFGPSAPTAAGLASSFTIAQAGSNADVYAQSWDSSWSPAVPVATDGYNTSSPRIVTLTGGSASQMIVYARDDNTNDEALMYSVLTGSTWSTPALVDNATVFTPNPVALAPLPGGGALLVYQGANGEGYFETYDGSTWTAPQPLVATSNPTLASPPQVAAGVCGTDAVVVLAESGTPLSVMTLTGGTWSTPVSISGTSGATYGAIATQP